MKKYKSYIVYGLLGILCLAALGYQFLRKKSVSVSTNPFSNRNISVEDRLKQAVSIPSQEPVVGAARGKDYDTVTREAIKNAGGLKKIIKKGDVVLIKPNLICPAYDGVGIITNYRMLQTIADVAKELGAKRVIVAEASPNGNVFDYEPAGYKNLKDVEIIDMNNIAAEDCYKLTPEKTLSGLEFFIPKMYMDADVVISAPILKTHYEGVVTLSLKNSFGVPPLPLTNQSGDGKTILHMAGLSNSIVDLNKLRKPDFVVVDGIVGGDGDGPLRADPVDSQIIFAGADPVAVDTAALNFMGFTIDDIEHVKLAAQEGIGIGDINKIKVNGIDLNKDKMSFRRSMGY